GLTTAYGIKDDVLEDKWPSIQTALVQLRRDVLHGKCMKVDQHAQSNETGISNGNDDEEQQQQLNTTNDNEDQDQINLDNSEDDETNEDSETDSE
ncbi:unnamed protein product, partial [Didymodactylos carnosus]